MYKVIKRFKDLKNNNHIYKVGDMYPIKGYEPTDERIAELSTKKNKSGFILIKELKETIPETEPETTPETEPETELKKTKNKKNTKENK